MKIRNINNIEEALPTLWEHDQKNQKINFPTSKPHFKIFQENILASYKEHPQGFFLIYENNKIIGSLILRTKFNPFREQKYGEIWYIYLEPEHRGKGYGRRLLEFADAHFKNQSCSYAFAGISALNPSPNALFETAGYTKTRVILEKEYL